MSDTILLVENVPVDLLEFFEPAEIDNQPSVLRVSSQGYPGAHFATFPPKLIEPMIKAGTSEKGACAKCGAPWKRVVDRSPSLACQRRGYTAECSMRNDGDRPGTNLGGRSDKIGWEASCKCGADVVPCVVLDPFMGSGTTACVCIDLGRRCWGIDLSGQYLKNNAIPRVEGALLRRPTTADLLGKRQRVTLGRKS